MGIHLVDTGLLFAHTYTAMAAIFTIHAPGLVFSKVRNIRPNIMAGRISAISSIAFRIGQNFFLIGMNTADHKMTGHIAVGIPLIAL